MPYISDKLAINNSKLDKRVKIQPSEHDKIKELYSTGDYSLRALGRMYSVDKDTISKIVNPVQAKRIAEQSTKSGVEYRERMKEDRDLKDKNNKHVRDHRKYKNQLYKDSKIEKE